MAEISTTDNIGSKITMALKAGSGVDINELATSLSEAESMPTINAVTAKKASATVSISGYGVLKTMHCRIETPCYRNRCLLLIQTLQMPKFLRSP
jgi:hypothetical protein